MTDEQKNTPSGTEQREENVDLYALFFKYFAYWPWFVASVLVRRKDGQNNKYRFESCHPQAGCHNFG